MAECQLPKLNTRVRFPSPAPQRRSKVRFAPTPFYSFRKNGIIRPLPCAFFPNATVGLAFGFGKPFGWGHLYCLTITYELSPFFEEFFRKTDILFSESLAAQGFSIFLFKLGEPCTVVLVVRNVIHVGGPHSVSKSGTFPAESHHAVGHCVRVDLHEPLISTAIRTD